MRVTQLWRFPVKSLQGERLDESAVDEHGLVGDRRWALFDPATGEGLTARRVPDLLFASALWHDDGSVSVVLPDGVETNESTVISSWLGRDVELRSAAATGDAPRYATPIDVDDESSSEWISWEGPNEVFHDSIRTQLSLCSDATLAEFAPVDELRRFRFNVVLDGVAGEEDALVGSGATLGEVGLDVTKQIDRCVMVTRPQPGGIERDTTVLKRINRERATFLGVGALVQTVGRIAVGDVLGASSI
jgi:uncharacterized protein YcbX